MLLPHPAMAIIPLPCAGRMTPDRQFYVAEAASRCHMRRWRSQRRPGRSCCSHPWRKPRYFPALRGCAGDDAGRFPRGATGGTGALAFRSDAGRSSRRPQPDDGGDGRDDCLEFRRFAQHGSHPIAGGARKDWLQPASRSSRAPQRNCGPQRRRVTIKNWIKRSQTFDISLRRSILLRLLANDQKRR